MQASGVPGLWEEIAINGDFPQMVSSVTLQSCN